MAGLVSLIVAAVFGLLHATQAAAQSQAEDAATMQHAFEVASIRQDDPHIIPTFAQLTFTSDRFIARNIVIQVAIVYAYDLRDPTLTTDARLIPGAPKWIMSDPFDIQAKMSDATIAELSKLSIEQQEALKRRMVQSLLADRFGLRVHRETKNAPAYMLVVAKGGPKNMKKEPDDVRPFPPITWSDPGHGQYNGNPMSDLVMILENLERVPVLDKTGLTGKYSFMLEFSRDPATLPPGEPPLDPARPSIFTALQEQLGLKMVSIKAPLETIVIDHIEKPSQN